MPQGYDPPFTSTGTPAQLRQALGYVPARTPASSSSGSGGGPSGVGNPGGGIVIDGGPSGPIIGLDSSVYAAMGAYMAFDGWGGGDEFVIPGPAGAPGAAGPAGAPGPPGAFGWDGADGQDGLTVPGPSGPAGANGAPGSAGAMGPMGLDGEEGPEGFAIPGPIGPTGASGAIGPQGPIGVMGMDGEEGSEGFPIPGPVGPQGPTGASGAVALLGTVTTAGSQTSVTFSSISGSYTHLRIIGAGRSARSAVADNVMIQFNSDTTAGNYGAQQVQGNNSTASAVANPVSNNYCFDVAGATATANQSGTFDVLIPMYASTTFIKAWQTTNGIPGFPIVKVVSGRWNVTTAITSITFVQFTGAAFVNGSVFSLYGIT